MYSDLKLANLMNRVRVLVAVLLTAINPRPRILTDKGDRLGQGCAGDTGIDCGVKNLSNGTHRRGPIKRRLMIDNMKRLDRNILEQRGAAGRGPLAEA